MFIVPQKKRVSRPDVELKGIVRANAITRSRRTVIFRIASDVRDSLGWTDQSRVRVHVGVGPDEGKVLLAPGLEGGPSVKLRRSDRNKASVVALNSSYLGRFSPPETLTVPHYASGDHLTVDMRSMPSTLEEAETALALREAKRQKRKRKVKPKNVSEPIVKAVIEELKATGALNAA